MDPFEARIQFSKMLSQVQPVSSALSKCTGFAIRNKEFEEDLHSCILEVLKQSNLNVRLNVMNFLDFLISSSLKTYAGKARVPYVEKIRTDLPLIVSLVVPASANGLYNLVMAFQLLKRICGHLKMDQTTIVDYSTRFNSQLISREESTALERYESVSSEKVSSDTTGAFELLLDRKRYSQYLTFTGIKSTDVDESLVLSKELIGARMENDRERHKKAKESLWVVERDVDSSTSRVRWDENEFQSIYEKYDKLDESDMSQLKELSETAELSFKFE